MQKKKIGKLDIWAVEGGLRSDFGPTFAKSCVLPEVKEHHSLKYELSLGSNSSRVGETRADCDTAVEGCTISTYIQAAPRASISEVLWVAAW